MARYITSPSRNAPAPGGINVPLGSEEIVSSVTLTIGGKSGNIGFLRARFIVQIPIVFFSPTMQVVCPTWLYTPEQLCARLLTWAGDDATMRIFAVVIGWVYGCIVWAVVAPVTFTSQYWQGGGAR